MGDISYLAFPCPTLTNPIHSFNMKCMIVFAVLIAAAVAAPQFPLFGGLYGGLHANGYYPFAATRFMAAAPTQLVQTKFVAPTSELLATTRYTGPTTYTLAEAPVSYVTGTKVVETHEPVEQHGYQIVY